MKPQVALTAAATICVMLAGAAQAQPPRRGDAQPPSGRYLQSCRDVGIRGFGPESVLAGECRDTRGGWRWSSLEFRDCRSEIINFDGQLACEGGRAGPRQRPGGWDDDRGGRPGGGYNGGQMRPSSITLYDAPDFNGRAFGTSREVSNLPRSDNDKALSLKITGRGSWELCTDSDFGGRCQIFDRDVPDLRSFGLGYAVTSIRQVR